MRLLAFACFCLRLLAFACFCLLLLAFACVCLLLLAFACFCSKAWSSKVWEAILGSNSGKQFWAAILGSNLGSNSGSLCTSERVSGEANFGLTLKTIHKRREAIWEANWEAIWEAVWETILEAITILGYNQGNALGNNLGSKTERATKKKPCPQATVLRHAAGPQASGRSQKMSRQIHVQKGGPSDCDT